ncbi:hypothetical protein GCM10023091_12880 [Ravibacter arvi]|uniref:Cytochrome c domain-containing protein n=1 Tax=Ravibacter arvi TaxID=2051041 RepID=A0ABP8LTG7_9BACT
MMAFDRLVGTTVKFLLFCMPAFLLSCGSGEPKLVHQLSPPENASVVIIGNTFADRLQHYNYFEVLLQKSFPGKKLTVRNLGWSADEIGLRSRPLNFPTQDELLSSLKADIILACYGMNEAFNGPDSLESFKKQLSGFLQQIKSQSYNGKSGPQVILVSPISHEKLGGLFPDPEGHQKNLAAYTHGMGEVARELEIPFIDLLSITEKRMREPDSLTINGIHLNDKGYKWVSGIMAQSLGFPEISWKEDYNGLKKVIDQKNQQFFYLYRAVSAEYIVGRRKEPWVQPAGGPISYPSELAKLKNMVTRLDSVVWKQSEAASPAHLAAANKILNDTIQFAYPDKSKLKRPSADQFTLPEGFEVNLFASEVDFSLTNPVKIVFDPKGRLWVADMPSYPQYLPGAQPNDKVLILEDTDQDGVADKETIFADSLYMPNSIELGKGGVYVSQPPNIWWMKDTDGDGKADHREVIMHGFGTEDVHHTLDTYTWGPDGALYWHTGTFLHSQVETPYGPRRSDYGATWRFEPETQRLEPYVSYPYANPWGHVFTRNGTEIISDVSTGMNYFAPPLTVASEYPVKRTQMRDFLTSTSKPKTCGTEIISSRQFPAEMQGDVLFNTFVGSLGVKQHRVFESGSGIVGQEIAPLLISNDPNFRPVDLQFGPDGALYVVDWYNPIINHGERALRDPLRDHTHGRIWRITYKNKEKLKPVDMTQLTVDALLDQLKTYEDRARYRARTQLRQMDAGTVIPATEKWLTGLDKADSLYDQHRLEGLWVYQQFHKTNLKLLDDLLKSNDAGIRTAATRVLRYWKDAVKNPVERLAVLSRDSSMKVRLQAIVSLSDFKEEHSVTALLQAGMLATDYYIDYALKEAFRYLKPVWWDLFRRQKDFLANEPQKAALLLGSLANEKELKVPGFITDDPEWPKYGWKALTDNDYEMLKGNPAVEQFRKDLLARRSETPEMQSPEQKAKALIAASDCFACHKEKEKLVGPAYADIARKYKPSDVPRLIQKVVSGGSGVWGDIPMTPHPGMEKADVETMVRYILTIK